VAGEEVAEEEAVEEVTSNKCRRGTRTKTRTSAAGAEEEAEAGVDVVEEAEAEVAGAEEASNRSLSLQRILTKKWKTTGLKLAREQTSWMKKWILTGQQRKLVKKRKPWLKKRPQLKRRPQQKKPKAQWSLGEGKCQK